MLLNEGWKLKDYDPGTGEAARAHAADLADADWLAAQAPGDVHTSLWAAGRIPDPYYHTNVEQVQWVEDREWWYRLRFAAPNKAAPGDRDILTFDGLDTYATVYLNGEKLGEHGNMHRAAEFDVTGKLRYGTRNLLAVRLDPVRPRVLGREVPGQWGGYGVERVWVRKTQSQFSWDWAPRCVNVGIWREVRLERFHEARLRDPYLRVLQADEAQAVVSVECALERWDAGGLSAQVSLAHGGQVVSATATIHNNVARAVLVVDKPLLWWPAGLGAQPLYDLKVELWQNGRTVDVMEQRVGLRTIALDRTPDPNEVGAENFTFVVNGVPVFAKGADWIPVDLLNGRVTAARYEELIKLLVEANGNCLRVWGGGQYEKPEFYQLCDQYGVLIWHDFMFGCALYPDHDPAFVAEVRAEAEYQVKRLRNHASIALWCGNNENDWIEDMVRWQDPGHDFGGKFIYHALLPEVLARLDPSRPYWPSSPYGGNDHNGEQAGDRHNWYTWHGSVQPRRFGTEPRRDWSPHGVSYRRYGEDTARFISEFGMHAAPVLETLKRNVPPDQLYFGSEGLLFRNKDNPKDKGNMLMSAHTGLPKDLAEYIDFSMICQAEGLKYGIEHYRRRKFHCSGTLFWQWNDCWPGLSWAVLDYYAFPKASYFFVKRAYAPVLASFKEEKDGGVSLWVTNDQLCAVSDTLRWRQATFGGQTLRRGEIAVEIAPNSSRCVAEWSAAELGAGDHRGEYLWVESAAGRIAGNRHFFVEIKDLAREKPQIAVIWREQGDGLIAELTSPAFAYFVWLFVPLEGTRYSDNWIDLPPGERRRITITPPAGQKLTPEMVQIGWR